MSCFRCYSCWRSLGYTGPKDFLICPVCDIQLWVHLSETGRLSETGNQEYNSLIQKLREMLAQDRDIFKGNEEAIASPACQYIPDAIYYQRGEILMQKPIIYEIITRDEFNRPATFAKCRLFSDTVQNLFSCLYLVVSRDCQGESGEELVLKMCRENGINPQTTRILTI